MMSPFDQKNNLAAALDRAALRLALFALCVGYFYHLWRSGPASLLAGGSLFALVLLAFILLERRTLERRDRLLRERVGGMIAMDELIMMPGRDACRAVRDLLCSTLSAEPAGNDCMRYGGELWLIRCEQALPGSSISEGAVLQAHRARTETGADKTALCATAAFSPGAVRAAEWTDPPVRLIGGRQLALLFGKEHPATDEEIARSLSRRKKPFSWRRIRALALAPAKLKRHLLCAFLLLLLYFFTRSPAALAACLFSYILALMCHQENRRRFTL